MEQIVSENNIDAARMWKLDEIGATPGKDVTGRVRRRCIVRRNGARDIRTPEWVRTNRSTLMPIVNADGDAAPPLFVFKRKRLTYRKIILDGKVQIETYASRLPRRAVLTSREENGGVDSNNFYEWEKGFMQYVQDLTSNGRKVLLVYNGYRGHMTLRIVQLFESSNIIAYALPAYTFGKTQACDFLLFGEFKRESKELIRRVSDVENVRALDMYDFCTLMTSAYQKSHTRNNIESSFRRSGLWSINASGLLSVPLPLSEGDFSTVISSEELAVMLHQKRIETRNRILWSPVEVAALGYIDTKYGALLTSSEALSAAEEKARKDSAKRSRLSGWMLARNL